MQGSDITAGHDATLKADGAINLLAAANTDDQHSTSSSNSAGAGIAISYGSGGAAFGFTANASDSSVAIKRVSVDLFCCSKINSTLTLCFYSKIDGYTWHHNAQSAPNKMQLIPTSVHGAATHLGQRALSKGK